MPTVTFLPEGSTLEVDVGTPLLAAVLRAGRPIGYACRGQGVCVTCRLRVDGPHESLSPLTEAELGLLNDAAGPYRLACLCRIQGDCRVRADYW